MGTQIIFLFGRPGVGKLTVGELLAADTGYRLLHNHAVVDLVTSLFSFGSPPLVALREPLQLIRGELSYWRSVERYTLNVQYAICRGAREAG